MSKLFCRRPVRPVQIAFVAWILFLSIQVCVACVSGQRSGAAGQSVMLTTSTPAVLAQSRSGLPAIRYQNLPKEAKETIALIDKGGPFPFDRDGITFQNREQLLPRKPNGYYKEYTVITPGSKDRGARRMIAGAQGELYYTDDHYESFREVIR